MAIQNRPYDSMQPAEPAESGGFRLGSLTDQIAQTLFSKAPWWWWLGFGISALLLVIFLGTIGAILITGVGLWGINVPIVWGAAIINLVFWIGIGHAGTFISAFLLLMRQRWRNAFSRFAEAMTLFALAVAGLFPLLHLGRPELFYWLAPYPNTLGLNPQWSSPLVWDFFAISTYALVSLFFWYIDLIPDLAAMRDKAEKIWVKRLYGTFALGWRGESMHWERLHNVSYVFAALATPLVISVHSVVGLDFAISIAPGWAHTIFPPYFVAGAIFSGFAMVVIFAVLLRWGFGLQNVIKIDYLSNAAKFMLVTGLLVGYGYASEVFGAWFTGHEPEVLLTEGRLTGFQSVGYWSMIFFNVILIQALWFRRVRRNPMLLVLISIGVLIGMWMERYIIISGSLGYAYLPSMWEQFNPTGVDWLTIISPFGLFLTLLFIFIRVAPVVPIYETQQAEVEEAEESEE